MDSYTCFEFKNNEQRLEFSLSYEVPNTLIITFIDQVGHVDFLLHGYMPYLGGVKGFIKIIYCTKTYILT